METRTALVTGSSRGIGRGIAIALAQKGFNIIVNYNKNKAAAEETAAEVCRYSRAIIVQADVSDVRQVERLFKQANENFGFVDTVINNAGIAFAGLLIDETDSRLDEIINTNFKGAVYICRQFLPDMLSRGFGRVVNISSIWGISGAAMETIYSATKAALIGFTKALSKEVATMGVTVNAIAPGAIDTDMLRQLDPQTIEKIKANTMAGRLGCPQDVAAAVEYLCSRGAEFVSGQVIGVNGEYLNLVE